MTTDEGHQTGERRPTVMADDEFSSESYVEPRADLALDDDGTVILGTVPGEFDDLSNLPSTSSPIAAVFSVHDEVTADNDGDNADDQTVDDERDHDDETVDDERDHDDELSTHSEPSDERDHAHEEPAADQPVIGEADDGERAGDEPVDDTAADATDSESHEADIDTDGEPVAPVDSNPDDDMPESDPDDAVSDPGREPNTTFLADADSTDGDHLEMRQVAGLTAGSMMKLGVGRAFEFNESNDGGTFSLRVLENGAVVVHPGSARAVVDEIEIEEPMLIGDALLNVSSACFSVRRPRPPASTESRMESIAAAFASISAITVPAIGANNRWHRNSWPDPDSAPSSTAIPSPGVPSATTPGTSCSRSARPGRSSPNVTGSCIPIRRS